MRSPSPQCSKCFLNLKIKECLPLFIKICFQKCQVINFSNCMNLSKNSKKSELCMRPEFDFPIIFHYIMMSEFSFLNRVTV